MRNTASVSIADQQVEEISNVLNIFYVGIKKKEAAVACKDAVNLKFAHVKEANRLHEAMRGRDFVDIMEAKAKEFGLIERV